MMPGLVSGALFLLLFHLNREYSRATIHVGVTPEIWPSLAQDAPLSATFR